MNPMVRFALVTLLAGMAAFVPLPPAHAEPSVTALAPATQVGGVAETAGFVPLELVQVDATKLNPVLRDVSLGERREQAWLDAFILEIEPDRETVGPVLNVALRSGADLEPGTYRLLVEVRGGGLAAPASLPVQAVVPAPPTASLAHEPLALRLVDLIPFPWRGEPARLAGGELVLRETSRKTDVEWLRFVQTGTKNSEGQPVLGSLRPKGVVKPHAAGVGAPEEAIRLGPVPAGETAEFELEAAGFPFGQSSGNVELSAPEMEEPLVIPFTLEHRLDPLLLLVPVLIGLAVGYFARVVLARRIEIGEVRAQADELLDRLAKERKDRRSPDFHAAVDGLRAKLKAALEQRDLEALRGEIAEVETGLATAIEEFEGERAAVAQRLGDLHALVHPDTAWSLPSQVLQALRANEVKTTLKRVEKALQAGRVGEAKRTLDECVEGMTTTIEDKVEAWRNTALCALEELRIEVNPLVEKAKSAASGQRDAAKEALAALVPAGPESELVPLVEASDGAHRRLSELTRELLRVTHARIDRLLAVLGDLELPAPELIVRLHEVSDRFFDVAAGKAERPVEALDHYREQAPEVSAELNRAVLGQLQGAEEREARGLLESGDYHAVEEALQTWLSTPAAMQGLPDRARSAAGLTALSLPAPTGLGGVSSTVLQIPGAGPVEGAAEVRRARTLRELAALKFVRFSIAAALILIAAYFVHEPDWVGTTREWVALFFWAFVLDVTIDTVIDVGGKVKGS